MRKRRLTLNWHLVLCLAGKKTFLPEVHLFREAAFSATFLAWSLTTCLNSAFPTEKKLLSFGVPFTSELFDNPASNYFLPISMPGTLFRRPHFSPSILHSPCALGRCIQILDFLALPLSILWLSDMLVEPDWEETGHL